MIELNVANIQFKSDKLIEILQKRIVKNDGFVTIDWQSEIHRFLCEGVMTEMTSIMWGDYGIEKFDECMAMNSFGAFEIIMKSSSIGVLLFTAQHHEIISFKRNCSTNYRNSLK